jgi:hypothetical protein
MKKLLFLIFFVTLSSLFGLSIAFGEESNKTLGKKRSEQRVTKGGQQLPLLDALPLKLEIISWVEVSFQGGLLREYKRDFERLIRLRLRNDLSMLSHEVKPINALRKELLENGFTQDFLDKEFEKRGCIDCLVWTTGEDHLVVFLTECKLVGYGDYENAGYDEFESRVLDFGSTLSAKQQVEDSLKNIITRISAKFLGAREHLKGLSKER